MNAQRSLDRLEDRLLVEACEAVGALADRLAPKIWDVCNDFGLRFETRCGPEHRLPRLDPWFETRSASWSFIHLDGPRGGEAVRVGPLHRRRSDGLKKLADVATEDAEKAVLALSDDLHATMGGFNIPITDYLSNYDPREP